MGWMQRIGAAVAVIALFGGCGDDDGPVAEGDPPAATDTADGDTGDGDTAGGDTGELLAGAASRSVLPTVDGDRAYLDDVPGWGDPGEADPVDPGVFVPEWDQGRVDVGNGWPDGSWVRDDLRVSALALERGDERVVLLSSDTYMHFAVDADAITERARTRLPDGWQDAPVLVAATHNHHGPDTAFSINDEWYDLLADESADAVAAAVDALAPASLRVGSGDHGFGVNDVRDPVVMDPRLNVLAVDTDDGEGAIATVVQWNSHPETTLGWVPPAEAADLDEACEAKGWEGEDCTAEGRYFTADYPGVLRDRLAAERGGEVLFLNGPLGNQIGPGQAPVWEVTGDHPVGDGWTVPDGADPVAECTEEEEDPYLCRSFAKTEAVGTELSVAVMDLLDEADSFEPDEMTVRTEEFFTRLTNIGFRLLIADGELGWQDAVLYTCDGPPSEGDCEDDGGETVDDDILTPFTGSQIRAGDAVISRLVHLDMGDVGFLFLPGELPPELVIGVPEDFDDDPGRYYRTPDLHAVGEEYEFPGYLLSLVDESVTFTVGLGTDELGYWVPAADYRLACLDVVLPEGSTCADLHERDVIGGEDWIGGLTCQELAADPDRFGDDEQAVTAACRYGQALGRELGHPPGHYEETNAAGWDLVDDLWAAAERLFGREGTGRVNPDLSGDGPLTGS
jgi:hypothetical protein